MNFYNINIKALEKRNIIIQEDFPENKNITEITLVNAKNGSPVLIINGKYTPKDLYKLGLYFLMNISVNCTNDAMTRMKVISSINSKPIGTKTR